MPNGWGEGKVPGIFGKSGSGRRGYGGVKGPFAANFTGLGGTGQLIYWFVIKEVVLRCLGKIR
jgi:hypothetical protein